MRPTYTMAFLAGLCLSPLALQAVPLEQTVSFSIYETPTDPTSNVVFKVQMTLVPNSEVYGPGTSGQVGWEVTSVQFTQVTGSGNVLWSVSYPTLSTLDGLWWVIHANMDNIDISEFVLPPMMSGTAAPNDPNDDDLDYDLLGVAYTPPPPPGAPPFAVTAALDYTFQLAMAVVPVETGSDEPVESDGTSGPT